MGLGLGQCVPGQDRWSSGLRWPWEVRVPGLLWVTVPSQSDPGACPEASQPQGLGRPGGCLAREPSTAPQSLFSG